MTAPLVAAQPAPPTLGKGANLRDLAPGPQLAISGAAPARHLRTGAAARTPRRGSDAARRPSRGIALARDWLFRGWYWYVNRLDRAGEVRFLNYGYAGAERPALEAAEEPERTCAQLYHHVAEAVDLRGKDVVEIGCGRGGGLAYVARAFAPATALGIDLEPAAVSFCARTHRRSGLTFRQGDAQRLSLGDRSCDAVLNVESSHRYTDLPAFLSEVRRILRPGGYLLLADYRYEHEMPEFLGDLAASGLTLVSAHDITAAVARALRRDDARRRHLVARLVPRFARGVALNFAGAVGSPCYRKFATRQSVYLRLVLRKPGGEATRAAASAAAAGAGTTSSAGAATRMIGVAAAARRAACAR